MRTTKRFEFKQMLRLKYKGLIQGTVTYKEWEQFFTEASKWLDEGTINRIIKNTLDAERRLIRMRSKPRNYCDLQVELGIPSRIFFN
jgi:hypothetical protein